MALTADYDNLIIHSDASITDVIAFHTELRLLEVSELGILHPVIHTYKQIDLGGAFFPAISFINSWTLQFAAGNWEIRGGNINAVINPIAGVYIKQTQSAAYAVTAIGAGGASPNDIATAVWEHSTASSLIIKLTEAWGRLGLDITKPIIHGTTEITFGDIVIAVTHEGTTFTGTRQ